MYVSGNLCFLLQVKCTPTCPDRREGQISLQRLNAGSSFIWQDETMSESPGEKLQKALSLHLISTRGLTSLWHLERHAEFSASKVVNAWLFLYIFRNPNITMPNKNWTSVSRLNSIIVCIVLPSLVYIPVISIITRQESWRRWRNTSFEWPSPH